MCTRCVNFRAEQVFCSFPASSPKTFLRPLHGSWPTLRTWTGSLRTLAGCSHAQAGWGGRSDPKGPCHGLPSSPGPGSRAWERRPEDAHHDPAWSTREASAGTAPARPWEQSCSLTWCLPTPRDHNCGSPAAPGHGWRIRTAGQRKTEVRDLLLSTASPTPLRWPVTLHLVALSGYPILKGGDSRESLDSRLYRTPPPSSYPCSPVTTVQQGQQGIWTPEPPTWPGPRKRESPELEGWRCAVGTQRLRALQQIMCPHLPPKALFPAAFRSVPPGLLLQHSPVRSLDC